MPDLIRREIRLHHAEPVVSRIVMLSGTDQSVLLAQPSKEPGDLFGWYVSSIGDLDGDGVPDFAVCAPASLIEAARGPEHPDGPRPAWRGRVDIISGATGGLLARVLNPEATFDSVFALGAAAVPDQDGDWIPDLVIGGVRLMLPPPAEEGQPATPAVEWRWWVASSATEQILRQGVGRWRAPTAGASAGRSRTGRASACCGWCGRMRRSSSRSTR